MSDKVRLASVGLGWWGAVLAEADRHDPDTGTSTSVSVEGGLPELSNPGKPSPTNTAAGLLRVLTKSSRHPTSMVSFWPHHTRPTPTSSWRRPRPVSTYLWKSRLP